MNTRRKCVALALNILLAATGMAQGNQPVNVSIYNSSTSIPFTDWWSSPIHPGIEVGTDFHGASDRRLRIYPGIRLGYLFHRDLFQGLYARIDAGLDYRHPSGISFKAKLGAGYLRTYAVRTEYRMDDGVLQARLDRGNHRLTPSLSWGLGYRLRRQDPRSPEIFLLHETWVEYPYAGDFIPVMTHTNIHLGATFYPFQAKIQK